MSGTGGIPIIDRNGKTLTLADTLGLTEAEFFALVDERVGAIIQRDMIATAPANKGRRGLARLQLVKK